MSNVAIHCNLKEILDERGISMRELARAIDYRRETVRQLCNNDIERLPLEMLARICGYLDVEPGDILTIKHA